MDPTFISLNNQCQYIRGQRLETNLKAQLREQNFEKQCSNNY